MSDALPFDLNNLSGGAVRTLIAPVSAGVPDNIGDVIGMVSPYEPETSWTDLGATTGPLQYGRNMTVSGYAIEQSSSDVLEVPQETTRTITVPLGEIRPDILKMLEESPEIQTIAADTGRSAQKGVPTGSISDLTQYRIAFVARRQKAQGIVKEGAGSGTRERGRLLAYIGYRVQLDADNVQMSFGKGALASAQLQVKLFPEPTITAEGEEFGLWLDEQAGTIATS